MKLMPAASLLFPPTLKTPGRKEGEKTQENLPIDKSLSFKADHRAGVGRGWLSAGQNP